MTLDITAEVEIGRPPAEVGAYAMDPANDPTWIGGIREARLITPAPIDAGSRVALAAAKTSTQVVSRCFCRWRRLGQGNR